MIALDFKVVRTNCARMTKGASSPGLAARLQSLLFVPGSRPDRFAAALASGADAVCIDLEDSVPAQDKAAAREAAMAAIAADESGQLILRCNGLGTLDGVQDLGAIASAIARGANAPPLLLLPKVENAEQLTVLAQLSSDRLGLVPLIESPRGLRAAAVIGAVPGVAGMMFGGGDLSAELGVEFAWEPLSVARGLFVLACAEAGVPAIDVPWIRLDDAEGLADETRRAKTLGFTAKAAIHPAQIPAIHAVMRPTSDEIEEARAAAFAFAEAGGAAVRFRGRMLEAPVMRRYRRILEQERHHA
jgi:citrate lyase beta subunit